MYLVAFSSIIGVISLFSCLNIRSPKNKREMKRTFRKIFFQRLFNHTSNWPMIVRRFYDQFFYVILWEGNVELNINQTYQYLVYYDHEKINTRIVNYAIDGFAFMSTLNSHRLDALGKVTEGFSQSRHFSLAPAGIKPLTGTAVD